MRVKRLWYGTMKVVMVSAMFVSVVDSTWAGDRLFMTQNDPAGDDNLIKVDQLTRGAGVVGLGTQLGYLSVTTGDSGLNPRVIDVVNLGSQTLVAVGGNEVRTYDASLSFLGVMDPDGPDAATGVDAIAIGDFGTMTNRLVMARETAAGANNILMLVTNALALGTEVAVPSGPVPGATAHGMALGDFQAGAGNEVLIGMTSETTAGGNGHQLFMTEEGYGGQFFLNRFISDVAAGEIVPGGPIEYVLTGNNDPGALGFGQGSHIFEANGAAGNFLTGPGLAGPHGAPPNGLLFNSVSLGNLDSDPEPEMAFAGNDVVRVLDGGATLGGFIFQSGPSNSNFVDVVIADVMDNDGVNEIVAVSDSGLVFVFGRTIVGDASSPFDGSPLGIFSAGNALLAVDAINVVPEPASWTFALIAGVMLLRNRR